MKLKYRSYDIVFTEIPNETTLALAISNCPNRCFNCHSPHLREDKGRSVLADIEKLVKDNKSITAVLFLGGDSYPDEMLAVANIVRAAAPLIKIALYSGMEDEHIIQNLAFYINTFDYIKLGSYKDEFGGLDSPNTNQRLYKNENGKLTHIVMHKEKNATLLKK